MMLKSDKHPALHVGTRKPLQVQYELSVSAGHFLTIIPSLDSLT